MRKQIVFIFLFSCACIVSQAQENIIITIAGNDTPGFRGDGGPATNALFNYPIELCLDNFEHLYIGDIFNNRIRKIDLITGIISSIAGTDSAGYSGDGGPASAAKLWGPQAICSDDSGNIYIGDVLNYRIRKINSSTGIITTIAGNGIYGNSGDGGPATDATFMYPCGLFHDKYGNLFITDVDDNKVRKIASSGIITTVAGNGGVGYSGDGGQATDAQLNSPTGVCVDSLGDIFICDGYNNVIRKIYIETGTIATIAGDGTAGYSGNGGPAINALLQEPCGIFINKDQDIYFAEWPNGVIRKIQSSNGFISTVAGCGVEGFAGDDGPATNAELMPGDVTIDSYGTMYIADLKNYRVRKVYNPALGITNIQSEKKITIYPNPAQNEISIENASGSVVRIFNLLGQEMLQFDKLRTADNKETINIESLISGTYIIQIIDTNGDLQNRRLVKE